MRNFILYMALFICSLSFANAQTDTLHLKFMNVSMEKDFKTFIVELKEKGFRKTASEDEGMLAGKLHYDRVTINVVTAPTSEVVSHVLVLFNLESSFEDVYQKYTNYINALSEKYGKPTDLSDTSTYKPLHKSYRENTNSLQKNGKKYATSWILPEGEITLNISENYMLFLTYYDRINLDIRNKEFKQIINKEL